MEDHRQEGMSRREFLRRAAAGAVVAGAAVSGVSLEGEQAHAVTGAAVGSAVQLPPGVKPVWDLAKAYREATPTRGRVCVNGLWRWQPAEAVEAELTRLIPPRRPRAPGEGRPTRERPPAGTEAEQPQFSLVELTQQAVPEDGWGLFKVPGAWPGATDPFNQRDSQTAYVHPKWQDADLRGLRAMWYQREITIPAEWAGRRIALYAEYLNSYAAVYIDGHQVGEVRWPWGEAELAEACRPGETHVLSLLVLALPQRAVMLSFNDTANPRMMRGRVERRGPCGDVYLVATPPGARITDVKVETSVRRWEISVEAGLRDLDPEKTYQLRAEVTEDGRPVREFASPDFRAGDAEGGRFTFVAPWRPDKLWDLHTPGNMYELSVALVEGGSRTADVALPVRFGFREFWIDGRDFCLNGTRLFLSSVPLDNTQLGAAWASYEGVKESLLRLKGFGINFVYTHCYSCNPGTHLSFAEALRAADDVGVLMSVSQPHFRQYDWRAPDAEQSNGYAQHAEFYVRMTQNHPAAVAYATSHNAVGYHEDMNPDLIDGIADPRGERERQNAANAERAAAIVKRLDPARVVYHHASGNLGPMHTSNFYPNFVPLQELEEWFEHWATVGVKPAFTCEYGSPFVWDWTLYRGWYRDRREFGSAAVPWEFCIAEWLSQFRGGRAYRLTEMEKTNLRWEAKQLRDGKLWHHWDYPYEVGSRVFEERQEVKGEYVGRALRAFRTWGLSATSPWEHFELYRLRPGTPRARRTFAVDWDNLQRPGLSPDFVEERYEEYQGMDAASGRTESGPRWTQADAEVTFERMDLDFKRSDWMVAPPGRAVLRVNMPLLAYIAGKPERFTSKDHNFRPGEVVEKQLIVMNNSRQTVTCRWEWSVNLPEPASGRGETTIETGQQERIPLRFRLPDTLSSGRRQLTAAFRFSTGEMQEDSFAIEVLPPPAVVQTRTRVALFDPNGETAGVLEVAGLRCRPVEAGAGLAGYDLLVIGRGALTAEGAGPDLSRVRDGLKVIVFEQTSEALEQRLGFRATEYGLRQVFPRVPDHPLLEGLTEEHLRDWRGEATLVPPRLKYTTDAEVFAGAPAVKWCGIDVTRVWRCGTRGAVASVPIEKPARGNFLPLVDGGFSLQYSPMLLYQEGKGMVLFCQLDVTGRTEGDPAAEALVRNALRYAQDWTPSPVREAVYAGEAAGRSYFEAAGLVLGSYAGGGLSPDQVLIAGPGAGAQLAGGAASIARWLEAGGHALAMGLDESEANAFLPSPIRTKQEEHISATFEAEGAGSALAGVSPADTMNRDPRELPLVAGGARVVGNGVLATAGHGSVVFCQLVPWQFDWQQPGGDPEAPALLNLKRTYRRSSFLVARLLANLGVAGATPLLERVSRPVTAGETRWLEGLYVDTPEEWDDPYRAFRW
jgi:beta-galactosidase